MEKREGPLLTIVASCSGCAHERAVYYAVQGDSGYNVSCVHPNGQGRIGDTTWATPAWCPLMPSAHQTLVNQPYGSP